MNSIAPSLPAISEIQLLSLLSQLDGVAESFQVDIVDGIFAPNVSWPFTEPEPLKALELLNHWSTKYILEIDCMVMEPEKYLDVLINVGARRIIIHYGSTEKYTESISLVKESGCLAGMAFNNDVPLDEVEKFVPMLDFVQLMGIKKIGAQGQPFDEPTLARAKELRTKFPDLEIAVDGSVNGTTISQLLAAGVNRFAPGSAISRANDPILAFKELSALINR